MGWISHKKKPDHPNYPNAPYFFEEKELGEPNAS